MSIVYCKRCSETIKGKHWNAKYCKACAPIAHNKKRKRWARKHPEYQNEWREIPNNKEKAKFNVRRCMWRQYGILNPPLKEEYDAMLATAQKKKRCAACKRKNKGRWHLHHNHQTGEWLGLICSRCNVGLYV